MTYPQTSGHMRQREEEDTTVRVMVLDVDAGIRQALSLVLDDSGYEVIAAADADVAAALLRKSRECVVVLFDVPGVRHADRDAQEAFARLAAEPSLAAR